MKTNNIVLNPINDEELFFNGREIVDYTDLYDKSIWESFKNSSKLIKNVSSKLRKPSPSKSRHLRQIEKKELSEEQQQKV